MQYDVIIAHLGPSLVLRDRQTDAVIILLLSRIGLIITIIIAVVVAITASNTPLLSRSASCSVRTGNASQTPRYHAPRSFGMAPLATFCGCTPAFDSKQGTAYNREQQIKGAQTRLKVDLHVHTYHSPDSLTTPRDVVRWARRRGLGALAITDHNTLAGAHAVREISPIPIIVGSEIMTSAGEIIGLFLNEEIPPGLSPQETTERIHAQGGLVYVPHPIDRVRRSALGLEALLGIIEQVDCIEILNARVTYTLDNRHAEAVARAYRLLQGAGSDAHQGFEIGQAYVELAPFSDAASFARAMTRATVHGRISSPLVHFGSTYAKVAKDLLRSTPSFR